MMIDEEYRVSFSCYADESLMAPECEPHQSAVTVEYMAMAAERDFLFVI